VKATIKAANLPRKREHLSGESDKIANRATGKPAHKASSSLQKQRNRKGKQQSRETMRRHLLTESNKAASLG
jgi:hypothetical protein